MGLNPVCLDRQISTFSSDLDGRVFLCPPPQDAEKVRQRRSRVAQTLNVEERLLGGPKHCRGFSVRQDPLYGRTAHTKCGLYLLGPSLAAALLGTRRVLARQGWVGEKDGLFEHPA
jgi:hypothetical protein